RAEAAARLTQGKPHPCVAKRDDVFETVAVYVSEQADVLVDVPAAIVAELCEHELGGGEAAGSGRECSPHPIVTERDDVVVPIVVDVGHDPQVLVYSPELVVAELREDEVGGGEPVSGGECGPHAIVAEADEVFHVITVDVGEHAWSSSRRPTV